MLKNWEIFNEKCPLYVVLFITDDLTIIYNISMIVGVPWTCIFTNRRNITPKKNINHTDSSGDGARNRGVKRPRGQQT